MQDDAMQALIVDDDVVSRMALVDLLATYGVAAPAEAADGAIAWDLLEQGLRPAICFCDVHMPRMNGIGLLERMKAHPVLSRVPFVLVSSASDRDTVRHAVALGAVGYILKPLHAAEARVHLDRIFRHAPDPLAEDPQATMARLQIGRARLGAYLSAFGEQLAAGVDGSPGQVAAFAAGCSTLGLWRCAALFEALHGAAPARVQQVLDDTAQAVACQLVRLHATGEAA